MKKLIKFVLFIAALSFQTAAFADDPIPVPLNPDGPILGGFGGPHKSPARPSVCPVEAYLNETGCTLELVSSENVESTICYIYNEMGEIVQTEVVLFDEGNAIINVATLDAGTYSLQLIVNSLSYSGTFILLSTDR